MDLGSKGKKDIVCAASKGLGKGCAQALAREGVDVTICARGAEALEATAKELGSAGVKVTPVACDVTTEAGRKEQCNGQRHPARTVRHRPAARHDAEDGGGAQGGAVGGGGRAQGRGAGGPLRLGGGVRLCRGLSVLGARGLHHGTESADRRRRLSRLALIGHLATAIAWSGAATEPRATFAAA